MTKIALPDNCPLIERYLCCTFEVLAGLGNERLHVLSLQVSALVLFGVRPFFDHHNFRRVIDVLRDLDCKTGWFFLSDDAREIEQITLSLLDKIWKQSQVNQDCDIVLPDHIVSLEYYFDATTISAVRRISEHSGRLNVQPAQIPLQSDGDSTVWPAVESIDRASLAGVVQW